MNGQQGYPSQQQQQHIHPHPHHIPMPFAGTPQSIATGGSHAPAPGQAGSILGGMSQQQHYLTAGMGGLLPTAIAAPTTMQPTKQGPLATGIQAPMPGMRPLSSGFHMDARRDEVKQQYSEFLEGLTFNSKVHINILTEEAKKNVQYYKDIVKIIENRIRKAPSEQKLPALYLLDSVVKNVGNAYKEEFSANIIHTFMNAYEQIPAHDDTTRSQYLRLLKTWSNHFTPEKVNQIEQMVAALHQRQRPQQQQQHQPLIALQPLASMQHRGVASGIAAPTLFPSSGTGILAAPAASANVHPSLPLQGAAGATFQGNVYVNPQMFHSPQQASALLPAGMQQQQQMQQQHQIQQQPMMQQPYDMMSRFQHQHQHQHQPHILAPPVMHHAPMLPQQQQQQLTVAGGQADTGTSKLLETLKNLGYLTGGQARTPTPLSVATPTPTPPPTAQSTSATRSPSPQSGTAVPQSEEDEMVHSMYDSMTLKCSVCGLRFRSREKLDHHMDKHFFIMRHRKENKVLSRRWFQSADSWAEAVDDSVLESPGAILFSIFQNTGASSTGGAGQDYRASPSLEDEETTKMPNAPVDDAQDVCTVCGEKFVSYFDKQQDEWLYRDAVREPTSNQIVHRACFRSLKKRLREEERQPQQQQSSVKHEPVDGGEPSSKRQRLE